MVTLRARMRLRISPFFIFFAQLAQLVSAITALFILMVTCFPLRCQSR